MRIMAITCGVLKLSLNTKACHSMKTTYILFTIRKYPEDNTETIFYIKKIKDGKPLFTIHKNEAMKAGRLNAFWFAIRYQVKSLPEKFI